MNIFEQATREKYRYPSAAGPLSTERLWELPLTAKNNISLDGVARAIAAELKDNTMESFVDSAPNPAKATLETKLEILKHIIAVRQEDKKRAESAAALAARKQKLLEILEQKDDDALKGMTREQILAEINALG